MRVTFPELAIWCRRRRLKIVLELVDHAVRPARDFEGVWSLRVRIFDRDGHVLVGRCQGDPGVETLDDLATSCAEILRRRGAPI